MPAAPLVNSSTGLAALKELLGPRNFLGSLSAMRRELGYIFSPALPGFSPVVLSGPEASHQALTASRPNLQWRNASDPVTGLLRHGLLVEDGASHDELRRALMPSLHRRQVDASIESMWRRTDQVLDTWQTGETRDMLVEMRRAALLILMEALFHTDFTPQLDRLLPSIRELLKFISPGLWLLGLPQRKPVRALAAIDAYFYDLIARRRADPLGDDDLLSRLIRSGMQDGLIRDQLLTLFIAGHDTSTALLAWTLYLVGRYPQVQARLHAEAAALPLEQAPTLDQVDGLAYFGQVINETLRLYPPIHAGNRLAAGGLQVGGVDIPDGGRVMISIYATHHDETHWPEPERFDPGRFAPGVKHTPYTYLPFGAGPRNCLGAHFAQVESKVVLARLLQRYDLALLDRRVRLHMGATLEPRPGVFMRVTPR